MDGTHFSIGVMGLTSTSRGTVTLGSTNPQDYPLINPRLFSTEHDLAVLRYSIRKVLKAMESKEGQEFVVSETPPEGWPRLTSSSSDEELNRRIKAACRVWNHPGGTAAMGGVLDSNLRVKGVKGLRVLDASILPNPITAHY